MSSSEATAQPSPLEAIRPADHVEHDLVGARADAVQPHVAPHPLDAVLLHVAGAAVDLDALVGDLDRDPRGVQLRHRDLPDGVLAVLERLLHAALGPGDAAGGPDEPLALELPHDVVEALALLAEQRRVRHPDVL